MLPHFRTYQALATIYGMSSGHSEDDWYEQLNSTITPIIHKALHHKLHVIASGCKHEYFWPCEGELYQSDDMRQFGARMRVTQVGQMIFPGLKFDAPVPIQGLADPWIKAWITDKDFTL